MFGEFISRDKSDQLFLFPLPPFFPLGGAGGGAGGIYLFTNPIPTYAHSEVDQKFIF